jgi:hypothetical protein
MKSCSFPVRLFSAIILIVFAVALPLTAQTGLSENPFDMVVKLHHIERTLTLIDKMTAVPENRSGASPTAIARGRVLLQSGEKAMAIENFIRAEELGSREFRRYLEKYGPKK